jgi:hypothetical protein
VGYRDAITDNRAFFICLGHFRPLWKEVDMEGFGLFDLKGNSSALEFIVKDNFTGKKPKIASDINSGTSGHFPGVIDSGIKRVSPYVFLNIPSGGNERNLRQQ